MTEKLKSEAVLCALPDGDALGIMSIMLGQADWEIIYARDWEEMMALLQSHDFKGVITVSSWVKLAEAGIEGLKFSTLMKNTPWMNFFDKPEHDENPWKMAPYSPLPGNSKYESAYIPTDVEELILKLKFMGLLPKDFVLSSK